MNPYINMGGSKLVKIVLRKEFKRKALLQKTVDTTVNIADSTLEIIETVSDGKAGKAARLLRELLKIFS